MSEQPPVRHKPYTNPPLVSGTHLTSDVLTALVLDGWKDEEILSHYPGLFPVQLVALRMILAKNAEPRPPLDPPKGPPLDSLIGAGRDLWDSDEDFNKFLQILREIRKG